MSAHEQHDLVITDLDGTLLDHHDYDFSAAKPWLQRLTDSGIPWVLNTSKTFAELQWLRPQLGHIDPFVVENGAALYWPEDDWSGDRRPGEHSFVVQRFARPLALLLADLDDCFAQLHLQVPGFARASLADVMTWTGLDEAAAARAKEREHSEPLFWQNPGPALNELAECLAPRHWQLIRGGRFTHVIDQCDKGTVTDWLIDQYQQRFGARPRVIALGDADNDRPMLERADIAVIIPRPSGPALTLPDHPQVITARQPGPAGWAEALAQIYGP